MFTGGDWLLLLAAWGVVSVLLAAAYSVTRMTIRRYRRNYSLLALCKCGHILFDHSRHSGRCQITAADMKSDFPCICMMFTPANEAGIRV